MSVEKMTDEELFFLLLELGFFNGFVLVTMSVEDLCSGVINPESVDIRLPNNNFGEDGGKVIAYHIENNIMIDGIIEGNGHMYSDGKLNEMKRAIGVRIRFLDLCGNNFGEIGGKAIGDALGTNPSITSINLSNNNLGEITGEAIRKALETNTSLTSIDLSRNNIGSDTMEAIEKALERNRDASPL